MFGEYVKHGWLLCPIATGKKAPIGPKWNTAEQGIMDPDVADELPGAGLLHAFSGTCAVDIDHVTDATTWLAERGVGLDELLLSDDAVIIDSGNPGHAKLLYALDTPLVSKKVLHGKQNIIDFRCATATGRSAQDVLPPTVHPSGRLYQWAGAKVDGWRTLPPIPLPLLALWQGLLTVGASAPSDAGRATVPSTSRFNAIRAALGAADPDCDRDTWVRTLAALHFETAGSDAGLELAIEWSAGSKKFQGRDDVVTRWRSFRLDRENPATLRRTMPATAEDFDVIEPEAASVATAAAPVDDAASAVVTAEDKKAALRALEARLIYVRTQDRYFDTETHDLLASDHAISHRFTPLMPRRKGMHVDPVKVLRESPRKRMVDALGFSPGEGVTFAVDGASYANTYRKRIIEPLKPTKTELATIEWLFSRIDDDKFRDWLLSMFAHVVQKPGVKIKSVPLIWSETEGNGKSTIMKEIPALLVGDQYSREVNYSLLKSDFADYLMNAWHINLAEFRAGTRAERAGIGEKLRPWVTDRTIAVQPKGLAAFTMPNMLWLTATSNEADAAPIQRNDRRWGVHELKADQMNSGDTNALYEGFLRTDRAAGVLRHYFLNYKINGFSPSAPAIDTEAKREMIEASLPQDIEILRQAYEGGEGPFVRDCVQLGDVQDFLQHTIRFRPSAHRMGRLLRQLPFNGVMRQTWTGTRNHKIWVVRNHGKWLAVDGAMLEAYVNGEDPVDITA